MEIGNVHQIDIEKEMRSAYLDYAMSVIVSRALPDARDGLKPVHRRILFGMHEMGMRANGPHKKSARIVGDVLGKYHPHGDSSVYEAMARMTQDFSMRYPLIDGQGNFGSVDGDSPAAMRYTEARLAHTAEEMLADIDKNTIDFVKNFDNSLEEPSVLPARLPNLLLNGASGIAVGMATNIPPHNLREICAALFYMIDHFDNIEDVSVEDLMEMVTGPDFPTGGIIVGMEGIRQAYSTGRGRVVVRGKAEIEEMRNGRNRIVITEIPYQVNKSSLIERIAELVRDGKISEISDLRDESDRNGMGIMIELKRGAQPRQILNQLYKYTPLQSTFGVQMLALVKNEPRLLTLKRSLMIFIEHRQQVITRRSQFELDKARRRAHILDGLLIALSNLDEIIKTIRQSRDVETARTELMSRFNLSDAQTQAILDMQLRRLAALERQKIEDERRTVYDRINFLEDLLANPRKILDLIKEELQEVNDKYGDERRTAIAPDAQESLSVEDLVADEHTLVSLTQRGYIKRVPINTYRTQSRGQVGVSGQTLREEDEVEILFAARTLQTILFFSDRGKVYSEKTFRIPEAGRTDRGVAIANILAVGEGERITAVVVVPDFDTARFCFLATVKGRVKRMPLDEFSAVRPSGLMAINLAEGDKLGWVRLTSGSDDIMMVSTKGQALRFTETEVRPSGRQAAGVTGIKFRKTDHVAGMDVVEKDGALFVITEGGYGKRTSLNEYTAHSRATSGITTISHSALESIGPIAAARVVQPRDEVTLISSVGTVLRIKVQDIRECGRSARGVHLMNLTKGGTVASIARVAAADLEVDRDPALDN